MDKYTLENLLASVAEGKISPADAATKIKTAPFEDLGYAKPDFHRGIRQGYAEVIYGGGKTAEQIVGIGRSLLDNGNKTVLVTRLSPEKAAVVGEILPFIYYETGSVGIIGSLPEEDAGNIAVITAGTSDIPVAEEAAVTARALGNKVTKIYDAGVSGLQRILSRMDEIMSAKVIIAIAGMDGALASVVGGLADCPVIAVPTSVGYGAAFGGLSALLSMLNSCASGVSVVNIDNGFGAAYQASMINKIGETKNF